MESIRRPSENFSDQINLLYNGQSICSVTFQVTNNCNCACTYCYQTNKNNKNMTPEVGKQIVDLLFELYELDNETYAINKKIQGLVLEFIGGEPLMNIETMDIICSYFFDKCIQLNHPWLYKTRIAFITNGTLYFNPKVQDFLKKFHKLISFAITIDGPKELHDSCRIYPNNTGTFDDAYKAFKHYTTHFGPVSSSKVTLAPENLPQLSTIAQFFVDNHYTIIAANCAYEPEWTIEHAKIFYQELKKCADILVDHPEVDLTLFDDLSCNPLDPTKTDDEKNWCGGTGLMIAFDPNGDIYPCIRYMDTSLNGSQLPIKLGDVHGYFTDEKTIQLQKDMAAITRRSQSTDECYNCPIARGCGWCSAWNYQCYGTVNKRCTNICWMHRARSLANVYFWNKLYKQWNLNQTFKMWLPKELALQIIDEKEYELLSDLSKE